MNPAISERDPFDALAEEFLARWRGGSKPSVEEYVQRYPDLADQIRELFPALVLMEKHRPDRTAAAEPGPGPIMPEELGEYALVREVGRGGMGVVYEAVQVSLQRHVALKVLPPHRLRGPEHLERFRREARIAAGLHHTNIVPVFGVGEHEGIHYYAMQFIRGRGLDQVLREVIALRKERGDGAGLPTTHLDQAAAIATSLVEGRFADPSALAPGSAPEAEAVRPDGSGRPCGAGAGAGLVRSSSSDGGLTTPSRWQYARSVAEVGLQVAEALDHAHRQGVLHRDIKPSNLLLDLTGRVWVTDFGLAKAEDSDDLTEPDQLVGTMRYLAPERLSGKADAGSDIYSLGATLYEMLALRPAFDGIQRAQLMDRVLHAEPEPLRKIDQRIPRDLETIVVKAMAKEPGRRYCSADRLAADLRLFLADQPIQARRPSLAEVTWRWCRRNPAVAGLSAGLALALLVLTAGLGWAVRDRTLRHEEAVLEAGKARADIDRLRRQGQWTAALAVADRTRALLAGASSGLGGEFSEWCRDLAMAGRLEEVRLRKSEMKGEFFDVGGADQGYTEAFLGYGMDMDRAAPGEMAELLRTRVIVQELTAALDDWASIRGQRDPASGKLLRAIARATDPDPFRNQVRDAMENGRRELLEKLAAP
jgi:eukaryotic-like serine/threonine-protein kinase